MPGQEYSTLPADWKSGILLTGCLFRRIPLAATQSSKRVDKAFFVHGFAKSVQDNVSQSELYQLKKLAKIVLSMTDSQLKKALESGAYLELPRS